MQTGTKVLALAEPCPGLVRGMQDQTERCRACGECRNVLLLLAVGVGERGAAQPAGRRVERLQARH